MSKKPSLSTQDLIDEFQIKCIGLITAEWSLLEATVSLAIWDFCNLTRERGLSVTVDLGSLAKIKMLSALAQVHFEPYPQAAETLKTILGLTSEMTNLNTERNIVAHSLWLPDIAGRIRSKRMSTKSGVLKETPISKSTEELMDLYGRITSVRARLDEFQQDFVLTPPSQPR